MSAKPWQVLEQGNMQVREPHIRARRIIRPSGGIVRGKFPSVKNGRMVHHEGLLELDAIYIFEASSRVVEYREQPCTVCYPDGPRLRRYTPDFELTLVTGKRVLVEVKPQDRLTDQALRHKLARIKTHFARSGQPFLILDDGLLRKEPRQSNLRDIYHRASRPRQPISAYRAVLARVASSFPMSLALATSLLASREMDPYSLLLAGLLRCDLDVRIASNTLLHINSGDENAWFCIASEHGF